MIIINAEAFLDNSISLLHQFEQSSQVWTSISICQ